jgi:sterol desaturase/sphingolipid hydroxylase (fatty acid hydroxylase superfamily)
MPSQVILSHILRYGTLLLALRLATCLFGAWLTYKADLDASRRASLGGFLRYCIPRQWFTMQSVRFDAYFFILARIEGIWLFAAVVGTTAVVVPATYHALTDIFGVHAQNPSTWPMQLALVLMCILVRDFGEFASHAIMHRYDFLWEFHKVHHSSLFLTPLGQKRAHFVEDTLRTIPNMAMVSVFIGIYCYVFSLGQLENTLYGIDAYALINVLCFETLRHSHVPLSFGRFEKFLMSPLQHQVHHNREGAPRNFGSFLACWDRMFGSFSLSLPKGSFQIGLEPTEQAKYHSLAQLYLRPFWNSGKILLGSLRRQAPAVPGGESSEAISAT